MSKRVAHNRLTEEQAIEDFIKKHGEGTYGYDNLGYVDNLTPVNIYCNVHQEYFKQLPKSHKKGSQCPLCTSERVSKIHSKGKDQFIKEAVELYGDLDDFSKVEYVNCKTEVTLICKIHNKEYKKTPDAYLNSCRCTDCSHKKTRSNDKELFIQSAIKKHGDEHDYTNTKVISSSDKVEIRCKKHNHKFQIDIYAYLGGQKCPKCSSENYSLLRMKSTDDYVEQAKEVYKNLNDYTDTEYKGGREEIEVRCVKHDYKYSVLPNNHLKGQSCPKCKAEKFKFVGGHHTKAEYIKLANGRITYLYLIKCSDKYEEFYKIGKTFRGLKKRFTNSNMPYDYEELFLLDGDPETIWDLEEELHAKYYNYRYRVNRLFDGYSECYNNKLPIQEIINLE